MPGGSAACMPLRHPVWPWGRHPSIPNRKHNPKHMKRTLFILTAFFALFSSSSPALAYDCCINGIYYNLNKTEKKASVTYYNYSKNENAYDGDVVIPQYINYGGETYHVTSVGERAFNGCIRVTSVSIPDSVTSIGHVAFSGCTALKRITIPNVLTEIGGSAFCGCMGLTTVTIPNSVTTIGDCAFKDCTGLTTITIPNSVTSIGGGAFEGCTGLVMTVFNAEKCTKAGPVDSTIFAGCINLRSLTIGENVTTIPYGIFKGCMGLTSVTIPKSVITIGGGAFRGCSGLTSVRYNAKKCEVMGTSNETVFSDCPNLRSLVIGEDVTTIPPHAFYSCSALASLKIPSSITSIGDYAFSYCTALKSVIIPQAVASIGTHTFNGCSGLTSVVFNAECCNAVGGWPSSTVFSDCENLTSLTIGEGVRSISSDVFGGCSELTSLEFNAANIEPNWSFSGAEKLSKLTIGNKVTAIPSGAFRGCIGLTSVTIPNSVTSIGDRAFFECSELKTIVIGESVSSIGESAFYKSGLISVNIPNSVKTIGVYAFEYSDIASVTIGNSVATIKSYTFYNCPNLKSMVIGSNVSSIGSKAIGWASNNAYGHPYKEAPVPKIIWLPNTPPQGYDEVKSTINYVANDLYTKLSGKCKYLHLGSLFELDGIRYVPVSPSERTCDAIDCTYDPYAAEITLDKEISYKGVSMKLMNIRNSLCLGNKYIKKVIVNCYGSLGSSAFMGCSAIIYAYVNAKYIGDDSFSGCKNLSSVFIGNSAITIGSYAFNGCKLTSVNIPNSVTSINTGSFRYCSELASVVIGNSVTSIGADAFASCGKLTSIAIPASVISIGSGAFSECLSLRLVTLGKSVSAIEARTFSGCKNLSSVTIPNAVKSIGTYAFYGCSTLTSITIPNNVTSIGDGAFSNCIGLKSVRFDAERCTEMGYTNKSNPITVFNGCSRLTSLVIGDKVSIIPNHAFRNCTKVPSVDMPQSVTTVGSYAFYGCSSLESITIPDNVKVMGANAFCGCHALSCAKIGVGLKEIQSSTFQDCILLSNISIPKNVVSIGMNVFKNCRSLANVFIADREDELYLGVNTTSVYNKSEPLFSDCPLKMVYIGGNIAYSTSSSSGYSPFYRNTSLEKVIITDKETEINANEFYGCIGLKYITMGDGIEKIGNWAFSGCNSLEFFRVGSNVKAIGREAFSDCTAMTKLITTAAVPPTCGSQALDDINKWNCELFVNKESIEAYKAADQWKEFFYISEYDGVDDVSVDAPDAVYEVYNLQGVRVGGGMREAEVTAGTLPHGVYILVSPQGRKKLKI